MQLHHEFVVPLGVEQAWDAFNDLERIAPAFPGASVTGVDGDEFTGTAKVKLGPISLQYTGTGRFASRDRSGRRAVIEASGRDRRGNGTAGATITASLQEEGPGATRVLLDTDLRITGRPAQFGRGVVQDVGGRILDQFAANLTTLLTTRRPTAEAEATDAASGGDAPADMAAVDGDPGTGPGGGGAEPGAAEAAPATAPAPAEPVSAIRATARTAGRGWRRDERGQLDLGPVDPALLRRHAPTLVAVAVTAAVTWWVARRTGA